MMYLLAFLAITAAQDDSAVTYSPPSSSDAFFYDTFANGNAWIASGHEEYTGEWKVGQVESSANLQNEQGLIALNAARRHGISRVLDTPLTFEEDVVIQYEVRTHDGLNCGGAYIKLLDTRAETQPSGEEFSSAHLVEQTPYVIMFGPDKCGNNNKVHFIFRHLNPVTGEYEEKHMNNPPKIKGDKKTHLYTLIIRTDNTYEILIDQVSEKSGSLLEDFTPPVNPPAEIDDPEDLKPEDWVDDELMKDPEQSKPEDWDEDAPRLLPEEGATMPEGWLEEGPFTIPDPAAVMPEDWDEEDDGEWEAAEIENPVCTLIGCGTWTPPMVENPDYKGKWVHPMIPNPAYIGEWAPRKIANPHFFVDEQPHLLTPIGAVGIEIWTMQGNIEFDNFFIDHSEDAAAAFAENTFGFKQAAESVSDDSTGGLVDDAMQFISENSVAVAVTVCAGIVLVVFVIALGSGRPAEQPVTPVVAAAEGDVKAEEGDEQAAKTEETPEEQEQEEQQD